MRLALRPSELLDVEQNPGPLLVIANSFDQRLPERSWIYVVANALTGQRIAGGSHLAWRWLSCRPFSQRYDATSIVKILRDRIVEGHDRVKDSHWIKLLRDS